MRKILASFFVLGLMVLFGAQSTTFDAFVSGLSSVTSLLSTDTFYINRSGAGQKATLSVPLPSLTLNSGNTITWEGSGSGSFSVGASSTGTPQYQGTNTSDNALAGYVGEFTSATLASPGNTVTSGVASNVVSLSLTPGDWDVWGACQTIPESGTIVSQLFCSLGTSSATVNLTLGFYNWSSGGGLSGTDIGGQVSVMVLPARFSISTTTTVYLVVDNGFSTDPETVYGWAQARRVR